ncbi:MAG: hypothetical protein RSG96_09785 [Clostridia bacterium]
MNTTLKRIVCALLLCCLVTSSALAKEKSIPDFCRPILKAWGAADGKDLSHNISEYWKTLTTVRKSMSAISIRLGGTTKELISNHKNWDIAIVSSKDVDLQVAADAGVIIPIPNNPKDETILHQWLLPEEVQNKLPVHPLFAYSIYCYDYNLQTDEAIFLLCNNMNNIQML